MGGYGVPCLLPIQRPPKAPYMGGPIPTSFLPPLFQFQQRQAAEDEKRKAVKAWQGVIDKLTSSTDIADGRAGNERALQMVVTHQLPQQRRG